MEGKPEKMSRASPALGNGLQTEMTAIRLHLAKSINKLATPEPPAPPSAPPALRRRVIAFKPKLPGMSPPSATPAAATAVKKPKKKLVMKIHVKSPALARRIGLGRASA